MSSPRGFTLTYASARRLDADHVAYFAHGGLVLPIEATAAPPVGSPVQVELDAPGDRRFVLEGEAARFVPGRGLMVTLSDPAASALSALDGYLTSADFRALRDAEPRGDMPAPEAAPAEEEELATDPRMGPPDLSSETVEEAPVDPRPRRARPAAAPARSRRPRPAEPSVAPAIPPARTSRRPRPSPAPVEGPSALAEAAPRTTSDIARLAVTPAPPAAATPSFDDATDHDRRAPALAVPEDVAALEPDDGTAPETHAPSGEIRPPEAGEEYFVFVVKFTTITAFLEQSAGFEDAGVFAVPLEDDGLTPVGAIAQLRLTLPGRNVFEMWAVVQAVDAASVHLRVDTDDEAFRKALLHPTTVASRKRLEREAEQVHEPATALRIRQEKPKEDVEKMPIRRRLARMGMDDKINLALSGGREERMALAMDGNKAVHHYLLKNAKITLDEIAFMARLPSLNPDVLDKIAENPQYTQNPTIVKALVYNPRTPIKTAIRLLDRLPRSEVMNLAKRTTMNARLVQAAKKKIERRKR